MSKCQKSADFFLEEFKSILQKRNFALRSIDTYLSDIRCFVYWSERNRTYSLPEIKRETVQQYQAYLYQAKSKRGKPFAVVSQIRMLLSLKLFLQAMCDQGRILFNPAEDIEFPRTENRLPRNTLNQKEIKRIFEAVQGRSPSVIRDRLIFELFYMTGIRIAELRGIKLEDIDFEHSALRIDHGKGDRTRFIPLLPRTLRMIRRYLEDARPKLLRGKKAEHLLIDQAGTPMDSNISPASYIRKYIKKAKIKKRITAHSFRHTFATVLLKNGAPIRHIQRLLGHEKIKTTLIYTHLSIEDLKKAHHRFHPFEHGTMREATP